MTCVCFVSGQSNKEGICLCDYTTEKNFLNGSLVCFHLISWLIMFKSLVGDLVPDHLGGLCMDANDDNELHKLMFAVRRCQSHPEWTRKRAEGSHTTETAFIINTKLVRGENYAMSHVARRTGGLEWTSSKPLPVPDLYSACPLSSLTWVLAFPGSGTACGQHGSGQTIHRQISSRLAGRARPLGFSRIQLRPG